MYIPASLKEWKPLKKKKKQGRSYTKRNFLKSLSLLKKKTVLLLEWKPSVSEL